MPVPEMSGLQKILLDEIKKRGKSNPISYKDLAEWLKVEPRLVRKEVEGLVQVHHQPIMSSYSPRHPGYFWPENPEEVRQVCATLIHHGVAIIKRARVIGKYSDEEVLGQLRIALKRSEEPDKQ